jgi:hypothetical protein
MYRFEIPRMTRRRAFLVLASGLPAGVLGLFVFPQIFDVNERIAFLLGLFGYYAIVDVVTEIIRR